MFFGGILQCLCSTVDQEGTFFTGYRLPMSPQDLETGAPEQRPIRMRSERHKSGARWYSLAAGVSGHNCICMHMHVYVYMCACVCIFAHIPIHIYLSVNLYSRPCVSTDLGCAFWKTSPGSMALKSAGLTTQYVEQDCEDQRPVGPKVSRDPEVSRDWRPARSKACGNLMSAEIQE